VMPSRRLAFCASACSEMPANSSTPIPSRCSDFSIGRTGMPADVRMAEVEDDIFGFLPGIILSTPARLDARCIRRDRRGRSR
jgi:hypothetical protein